MNWLLGFASEQREPTFVLTMSELRRPTLFRVVAALNFTQRLVTGPCSSSVTSWFSDFRPNLC
jgi:hypothetical protein